LSSLFERGAGPLLLDVDRNIAERPTTTAVTALAAVWSHNG